VNYGVRVEVVEQPGDLGEAWDDLVERSFNPSPFLRSWWVNGIGPEPGRLHTPLVFDSGELIGGLPLVADRLRKVVPHLRPVHGVHDCEIAAASGREAEVADAIRRWLERKRVVVDLRCTTSNFAATLTTSRWLLHKNLAAYDELPDTFEAYLASRSHNRRKIIKRCRRNAEREGISVRLVEGDIAEALDRLRELHLARWQERSAFSPIFPRFSRAAKLGAARGECVVWEAVRHGIPLASLACLEAGGCTTFYQAGRDPGVEFSLGTLLYAAAIERACSRGHRAIDFGYGAIAYKAHLAGKTRTVGLVRGTSSALLRPVVAQLAAWRGHEAIATY